MKINRVSIAGPDNKTEILKLALLQKKYPFVEWGILLSGFKAGTNRYPDAEWLYSLMVVNESVPLNLSGHICGKWMRDILAGHWTIFQHHLMLAGHFNRWQFNCHGNTSALKRPECLSCLKKVFYSNGTFTDKLPDPAFIFPWNGGDHDYLDVIKEQGISANLLFDISGGKGIKLGKAAKWPKAIGYTGYAGGLNPDDIEEQIAAIDPVIGDQVVWLDLESGVRTDNEFDLEKVEQFLKIAQKWVV